MTVGADATHVVAARADYRCEYCRMHQELQGATFHVEHIIANARGGSDDLENLAWACPGCNLRKSDRLEYPDPDTARAARLFNPRLQQWVDHFEWRGLDIVGRTPEGRATVACLDFNTERRRRIRSAEKLFGLFDG